MSPRGLVTLPNIDTLVSDIEGLFEKGATLTEQALQAFTTGVGSDLEQRFAEYSQERVPYLRLSNVGKPLRQLWFEINGPKAGLGRETLPPSTKLKFMYGSLLERFLILLAIEAGHTVTDLQRKVEVDGVQGSIDCIIDGILIDVKSASSFSFRKFQSGGVRHDDPFGYIGQLSGYSISLGGMDSAFLVVDKTLGHLCLDRYSKEELASYDVRRRIAEAQEVLGRDEPPETKCYPERNDGESGNRVLSVGCSYCAFKSPCWSGANGGKGLRTFIYSTGPKYFTNITQEPRVQEVIS